VRVLALDFGAARTGVAVSDATGTLARPLTVIARVNGARGFDELIGLIGSERPDRVVVGMPTPLGGGDNRQSRSVRDFVRRLTACIDVPVLTYDERFTTVVAERRGGEAPLDARAAALLLEDYLRSLGAQTGSQAEHARDE